MKRGNYSGRARIRVVGVGGAGNSAINRMVESGIRGVEFVAVNTDLLALSKTEVQSRICIGKSITRGFGAGGNRQLGEQAAYESLGELQTAVTGSDLVLITAGMGGGTANGASPIIAEVARDEGILTIAVVTMPFHFEGEQKMRRAKRGLERLRECVDTLVVIPNERLLDLADSQTSINKAFRIADDVLHQSIQVVSDLLTQPGIINLDFANIRAMLLAKGRAFLAVGEATGANRADVAARQAMASPIMGLGIEGARHVLVNVTASSQVNLWEIKQAVETIRDVIHPDTTLEVGTVIDEQMDDSMRVAVVATGIQERPFPVAEQTGFAIPNVTMAEAAPAGHYARKPEVRGALLLIGKLLPFLPLP